MHTSWTSESEDAWNLPGSGPVPEAVAGQTERLDLPAAAHHVRAETDRGTANPVGFQAELPRLAAQLDATAAAAHLTGPAASPPPKRPKGRLITGSLLLGLLLAGMYIIWDGVFRYQSYGLVTASRMAVCALNSGTIQRVYVSEGDRVRTGDLLLVMDDLQLQRRLTRTQDDLAMSEAQLDALMAELQAGLRTIRSDAENFSAEYFELASRLRAQRAELERLNRSLARALDLRRKDVLTEEQYDEIHFAQTGEKERVQMLEDAVEHLRQRAHVIRPEMELSIARLRPALLGIDHQKQELMRLREDIARNHIYSPLSGIVVKRQCLTGHRVRSSEVLLEIVEEGSARPVIYLSQNDTRNLQQGQDVRIHILPQFKPLECTIDRVGTEYVAVPDSLERFYSQDENVLPVFLTAKHKAELLPGATVRVPHSMSNLSSSMAGTVPAADHADRNSDDHARRASAVQQNRISWNFLDHIRHD